VVVVVALLAVSILTVVWSSFIRNLLLGLGGWLLGIVVREMREREREEKKEMACGLPFSLSYDFLYDFFVFFFSCFFAIINEFLNVMKKKSIFFFFSL
jgi:hypothetical protein